MDVIILPLLQIALVAINLYVWIIIISAVLSWLVAFNVVNTRNRFVYMVMDVTYRLTEPALRPIRNFLPNMGGLDLSPIALILILYFLEMVLQRLALRLI